MSKSGLCSKFFGSGTCFCRSFRPACADTFPSVCLLGERLSPAPPLCVLPFALAYVVSFVAVLPSASPRRFNTPVCSLPAVALAASFEEFRTGEGFNWGAPGFAVVVFGCCGTAAFRGGSDACYCSRRTGRTIWIVVFFPGALSRPTWLACIRLAR